jgi:hypothetical protein
MVRIAERVEKAISGTEVVKTESGIARFERGRTYVETEVDDIHIRADFRNGEFEITVSQPTGVEFPDGTKQIGKPVRISGHKSKYGIPASLDRSEYF